MALLPARSCGSLVQEGKRRALARGQWVQLDLGWTTDSGELEQSSGRTTSS